MINLTNQQKVKHRQPFQFQSNEIKKLLLERISPTPVSNVIIGINWTLVEGEGRCGLAQTPIRNNPNCQPVKEAGRLGEMNMKNLAELVYSDNLNEVAIGMAAINAEFNQRSLEVERVNGLDLFRGAEGQVSAIGRFPGLKKRYPKIKIIELEPLEGEYSQEQAEDILNKSTHCIITASTFVNGTLEKFIYYARNCKISIVGPGTPLCKELHDLGINTLSGIIITDPRKASILVQQGGAMKQLKSTGYYATISHQ